MADKLIAFYPHRRKRNGSYDSICLSCFATIASANTEIELLTHDSKHTCDHALLSMRRLFLRADLLRYLPKPSASDHSRIAP